MYKITYLPLAESDLLEALDYLAHTLDAPKAANDLLSAFEDTVQRIAEFPYAFELYRTDRPMKDEIRKELSQNSGASAGHRRTISSGVQNAPKAEKKWWEFWK